MTYRVTRLTCSTCQLTQRLRIRVEGDVETIPPCEHCGEMAWADEVPSARPVRSSPVGLPEVGTMGGLVWLENHNDGVQEQRDRTRGDRARMWKEVWELLG